MKRIQARHRPVAGLGEGVGGPVETPPAAFNRRLFGGLLLVALAVRLFFVWEVHDSPAFSMLWVDSLSYDQWARTIAAGDWLGKGIFYQAPLYPYLLGVVYRLFTPSILLVALIQSFLGAVSCVLLALAGTLFFGLPTGLISGLLLALYPTALFSESLIQKSSLDIFFTTLLLYLLGRTLSYSSRGLWMVIGMVLGCLTLTRENAAVLVPVVLAWVVVRSRSRGGKETAWRVGLLVLGVALLLLPVGFRNRAVGGEFQLTTSQLGPNLYIGNNPQADGTYRPLVPGRDDVRYESRDAASLAERRTGRRLSPGEVSRYWTGQALGFISANPLRWLKLMGLKAMLVINRVEVADAYDQYSYARWSLVLRALNPILNFGLLVPLAALGVVMTWPVRRRHWLLYAMPAIYAASLASFYILGRYRIPLIPFLMLFAAAGVAGVRETLSTRRAGPVMVAGGIVVMAAILANWPVISDRVALAQSAMSANIGSELLRQEGRAEAALPYFSEAIRLYPGAVPAYRGMSLSLLQLGKPGEALPYATTALSMERVSPENNLVVGKVLIDLGRPGEAIPYFVVALRYDPELALGHVFWAEALEKLGRPAEAAEQTRAAARLQENLNGRQ